MNTWSQAAAHSSVPNAPASQAGTRRLLCVPWVRLICCRLPRPHPLRATATRGIGGVPGGWCTCHQRRQQRPQVAVHGGGVLVQVRHQLSVVVLQHQLRGAGRRVRKGRGPGQRELGSAYGCLQRRTAAAAMRHRHQRYLPPRLPRPPPPPSHQHLAHQRHRRLREALPPALGPAAQQRGQQLEAAVRVRAKQAHKGEGQAGQRPHLPCRSGEEWAVRGCDLLTSGNDRGSTQ